MSRLSRNTASLAMLSVLSAAWAGSAGAESATATSSVTPDDEAGPVRLEAVVVTATRREQQLTAIPASVSAISGEDLASRASVALKDFIMTVPGVTLVNRGPNGGEITIRGLAASATFVSSIQKTTVGYYVNDVPLSDNPQAAVEVALFDMKAVEISRGPQGTLFGEGAPGGIVRYLTNTPDLDRFEGAVAGQGYSYTGGGDSYILNGMVNLPVSEGKFALRLVGSYRDDGGYVDSLVGPTLTEVDENSNASTNASFRAAARWQATEKLQADFLVMHSDGDSGDGGGSVRPGYIKRSGLPSFSSLEYFLYNLTLTYDAGPAVLTSSTNYVDSTGHVFFALPVGGGNVQTQDEHSTIHNFVQEFRAVSRSEGALRWVAGAFYKDQGRRVGLPLNAVNLNPPESTFELFTIFNERNYRQYAIYGELEYDLSPRFTVVAGARQTWEKLDYLTDQVDLAGFFFPTIVDTGETSYDAFSPKLSLMFRADEDHTLYATVAKGFRGPGVKNFYTGGSSTFGAETVLTYEVGGKAYFLDKRLFLAAAAYYNDWTDMQIPLNFGPPWASEITNAGKAVTKGAELEANFAASENWRVGGTLSYIRTELKEYAVAPSAEGNELGHVPDLTFSVYVDGRFPFGGDKAVRVRADYMHAADAYEDIFNGPTPDLEAYQLLNARIGLEGPTWDVYLFGRNLTDDFITYAGRASQGFSVYGPRSVGIGAGMRF